MIEKAKQAHMNRTTVARTSKRLLAIMAGDDGGGGSICGVVAIESVFFAERCREFVSYCQREANSSSCGAAEEVGR
jgi:hypothetical protein